MKKRIINLTIGLTGLIVSFLPQKAEAAMCAISCGDDWCFAIGTQVECKCVGDEAVCSS